MISNVHSLRQYVVFHCCVLRVATSHRGAIVPQCCSITRNLTIEIITYNSLIALEYVITFLFVLCFYIENFITFRKLFCKVEMNVFDVCLI